MIHENHRGLSPPLTGWQYTAFNVAAMAAMFQDAEQDVVMAVANRYYARAEERVVSGWKEEKWDLDEVQYGRNVYVF